MPKKDTEKQSIVITGDGNVIGDSSRSEVIKHTRFSGAVYGPVHTGSGDIVVYPEYSTDMLFEQIYNAIDVHPNLDPITKSDLRAEVEEIQDIVCQSQSPDESYLSRRLRIVGRIEPGLLEMVLAALTNPAAGFSRNVTAIARKVQESVGGT
jgi:hypothetical protein